MFSRKDALLVVVDIQERLLPHIHDATLLQKNALILIESCKALNVPILVTEQYPEGIGPTVAGLKPHLEQCRAIAKRTFSCCREPEFMKALKTTLRKQIILTGIETHVCVYQTAADLVQQGYAVQVAADAVSSRTVFNKEIGLNRIKTAGGEITSVESTVFELLETSAGAEFKSVLRLLK